MSTLELSDHTGAGIASQRQLDDAPDKQEVINRGLTPNNNLDRLF
jgi:hypothetical protein